MSLISKIFFEMISFFLWTGTILLIALYLQVFSLAIVFKFAINLQFLKEISFGYKAFPKQ